MTRKETEEKLRLLLKDIELKESRNDYNGIYNAVWLKALYEKALAKGVDPDTVTHHAEIDIGGGKKWPR